MSSPVATSAVRPASGDAVCGPFPHGVDGFADRPGPRRRAHRPAGDHRRREVAVGDAQHDLFGVDPGSFGGEAEQGGARAGADVGGVDLDQPAPVGPEVARAVDGAARAG